MAITEALGWAAAFWGVASFVFGFTSSPRRFLAPLGVMVGLSGAIALFFLKGFGIPVLLLVGALQVPFAVWFVVEVRRLRRLVEQQPKVA